MSDAMIWLIIAVVIGIGIEAVKRAMR